MRSFLLPLVYFLLANGTVCFLFKKTFGKGIVLTMVLSTLVYFFSQVLLNTFQVGWWVNLLLAFSFLGVLLFQKRKGRLKSFLRECYLTKGFYLFLVLYICIYIFDFSRCFTMWDEFSHWGVMVKEMLRLDRFYTDPLSTLMVHQDYPPMIQLFELFYVHLSGTYQEASLLRAIHLFSFSLFIPFACGKNTHFSKIKLCVKELFILGSAFFLLVFFDQHHIVNTIYIDYALALFTAYLLIFIFTYKKEISIHYIIELSLYFSFFILIKQIAFPLYLLVLFFLLGNFLFFKQKKRKLNRETLFVMVFSLFLLFFTPITLWSGWNHYTKELKITKQFQLEDLKLFNLSGIVQKKRGEKWQQEAAQRFLYSLPRKNMTTSYIHLSYFGVLLLCFFFLYLLSKKHTSFSSKQFYFLWIMQFLGSIGYAFVMLVLYVFSFGPEEGPNLASFNRYMPTYLLICVSSIYMLFIYLNSQNNHQDESLKKIGMVFLCILLFQNPKLLMKACPKVKGVEQSIFESQANQIKKKTKPYSKIFLVAQNTTGEYQFYVKYYLGPRTTNLAYFSLPVENMDIKKYYEEELKPYLKDYDYVYLSKIDDAFKEKYEFLLKNKIEEGSLYKIKTQEEEISLTYVS